MNVFSSEEESDFYDWDDFEDFVEINEQLSDPDCSQGSTLNYLIVIFIKVNHIIMNQHLEIT